MRYLVSLALVPLLLSGCAAPVVKSEQQLSQSVSPGLELLSSLHRRAVSANAQDLLLQWPGNWSLSETERSDFIQLVCRPHSAVNAAIANPLAAVVNNQKVMDATAKAGGDFDILLGYIRTPKTSANKTPVDSDCATDVSTRLARQLVSADAVPSAVAVQESRQSTLSRVGAIMPKLLGLGDDVARARALRTYVRDHKAEIETALASIGTPENGSSAAGRMVEQLRDHHLRETLAYVLELRRNATLSLSARAEIAERAVRHLGEYDTLMDIHMDGPDGTMPIIIAAYSRYLDNIETGNSTPIEGVQSLVETAQRVRGLGVLPF